MGGADTIFALSSGTPPAALAVIRISGDKAWAAVQTLTGSLPAPRRASLRTLRHPSDDSVLDKALVLLFPGPLTATGEDLAELHLHGGRAVVRAVEAVLAALPGVRLAEAGEFTRRAFSHGRIDLNEAEGLADLLSAETEWQRRAAVHMAGGTFSREVETWRTAMLALSASVEAILDFSDEDDVDQSEIVNISNRCEKLSGAMTAYLAQPHGEKLRDGLRVVIAGPPNSGKSTLLNALVSREAAIVSDIAGTTRDLIEVPVAFDGIPFLLTDTAGLRSTTDDAIEEIGIARAEAAMAAADIVLWLGPEGAGVAHPIVLEIAAKADDVSVPAKSPAALSLSAKSGVGVTDLVLCITQRARSLLPPADGAAINARQRALIGEAETALRHAQTSQDLLIIAEELRAGRVALDALTGRASTEDLLDTLFGRFCIGK